ncbi:MAG: hypothetical protein RTU30_11865 [Candidatus Thorarchaeota archaeon]
MRSRRVLMLFLFTIIGTLAFSPIHVEANDPAAISLDYDFGTQILTVTVTHSVGDPNTHYIASIEIRVNGVLSQTGSYTDQDSTTGTTETFTVPAEDGDVINAKAICSISGQIQDEITVVAPTTTSAATTTAPGTTSSTEPTTSTTTTETSVPPPNDLQTTTLILIAVIAIFAIAIVFAFIRRR